MDYAAPLTLLSNANIRLLQGVQYQALRIIFKAPYMASSTELHAKAGIESIKQRLMGLSKKYVERATKVSNPLILKLLQPLDTSANGPLAIITRNYVAT